MITRHKIIFFYISCILCLCLAEPQFSLLAQDPSQPLDRHFGIVETYVNVAEANAARAGYTRIILRWDIIQPGGRDDWKPANVPDPFIQAELNAGREIAAILIGTPNWASQGANDLRAVPDMDAWANFTKRMAQQYQGRIQHWFIWNEPDVWDLNRPSSTWLGTAEDYAQLLKVAYHNIKGVDPTMQVYLAGLTYYWDAAHGREQFLSRLLRTITADAEAEDHQYYFDGLAYHLYYNPKQMFSVLQQVKSILDRHRLGHKAIWINETNAPPTDDLLEPPTGPPQFQVSSAEQAAFVIQAFAMLLAGGAERVAFYKFRNSQEHPESFEPYGMLRHDNSRRPVFKAYQVITTYFAGYRSVSWFQQGPTHVVTLDRGGQTTTVLWNTSPQSQTFILNAIAGQALLVNEQGTSQTVTAINHTYTIQLPGTTCPTAFCFIGGPPRLLVETGSSNQRPSLIPLVATETPAPRSTSTLSQTLTTAPTTTLTPRPLSSISSTASSSVAQVSRLNKPQTVDALPADVENTTDQALLASNTMPQTIRRQQNTTQGEIIVFHFSQVFTLSRLVILIILGSILFTLIYAVQFRLWQQLK